jgi:alkylhydroperoxidase family enzyme
VGVNDEEIANIRNMDVDKMDLPEKEKRLFALALKAHADPHSVTDEDFSGLREVGVTDQEIVEILEVTNFGDSINRFCDTLGIGPDAFLTYEMHP